MTYDYTCTSCLHNWEEEQSIKDVPHSFCPNCKKETAKRLISGGNFVLKPGGVGWYNNGYSSK